MPEAWTTRVWREHRAGNLSRTERDCLLTLATFRDRGGVAWPSMATLANRVRCSSRSVGRALAMAAKLGLLRWSHRHVRVGWRRLRTSSVYRFIQPATPIRSGLRPTNRRGATNGHAGRGGESEENKTAMKVLLAAAQALPDLLAARRLAMESIWLQRTATKNDASGVAPAQSVGPASAERI